MKMSKNYRRLCAVLGLSLVCGTGALTARSGSIPVTATYRNIQISYNGQIKNVTDVNGNPVEPFAVNGTTYVPVRGVGQIFGVNADWNGATNTVVLSGGNTGSNVDVSQYITKINDLQNQLTAAQNEIARLKANGTTSTTPSTPSSTVSNAQLEALEEKLNDEYATELSGIDFEFDVKRVSSSSKFNITLTYSRSNYDSNFKKLVSSNTKKLNNYLEEICEMVVGQYPGNSVDGTIYYNNTEKYNFSYSKSGKYEGTAVIELDDDDIERYIEDEYSSLATSYGIINVKSATVSISDSQESISCTLYINTPSAEDKKQWNDSYKNRNRKLEDELARLAEDIQSEFQTDYTVNFTLSDNTSRTKLASYRNESLSTYTWE